MFAPKVARSQTKATANSTNGLADLFQRTAGDRATRQQFPRQTSSLSGYEADGDNKHADVLERVTTPEASRRASWDFGKFPVFPPSPGIRSQQSSPLAAKPTPAAIQAKLKFGQANDPLEHEADRLADQAMHTPDADLSVTSSPVQLNRKCTSCCPACEKEAQTPPTEMSTTHLPASRDAPGLRPEVLSTPGQALDAGERRRMERRFGHDFSTVRIHADTQAAQAAEQQGALAFTVGQHIFFGSGQYRPEQSAGRRLLAHELVHTLQQRGSAAPPSDRDQWRSKKTEHGYSWSRAPHERAHEAALEREAESFATSHDREPANQASGAKPSPIRTLKAASQSVARARTSLPSPVPLCGKTLTDIEILPFRAQPLEPCLPPSVLVTRINIVGRDATSPSGKNQVFNLHLGYFQDPATGKYCAIADDSKECICSRCKLLGCFLTLKEALDALAEFAKTALLVLGVLILAWIIAEIIAAILVILAGGVVVLASANGSTGPSPATGPTAPAPAISSAPVAETSAPA
jgi:hypothetical protein